MTASSAELAGLAGLLADRTRAAFCLALLDGRAWTAGELAAHAEVAPSTASEHLHRLIDGGLLVERRQGQHRYDHLAGWLGVAVSDAMTGRGLLNQADGFAVTEAGLGWLERELRASRRPLAKACLDWTERRSHLAGSAGALMCRVSLEWGWIKRIGSGRAVRLTPAGSEAFEELLGLTATG